MGKWLAGIAASVIAALVVWWVVGTLETPPPTPPPLEVSAWYAPQPMRPGKTIEIFVKVLREDDRPIPNASVKLTPIAGTFTWASAGSASIEGRTDRNGLFSTKFQTVLRVGVIGGTPSSGNSQTGKISVFVSKAGYKSSKTELVVVAAN